MRERVEDLGRIAVMVDGVLEMDFFEESYVRPKDFCEWFYAQTDAKRWEILVTFIYGRDKLNELLYDIREIARGEDPLNARSQD